MDRHPRPLAGIGLLPAGKRRRGLDTAVAELVLRLFGPRILPFDRQAATVYAKLVGRARAVGRAITVADGQIAAIAAVHGFAVATQDAMPFAAAGVPAIDPWEPGTCGTRKEAAP